MNRDHIGSHEEIPFPLSRVPTTDTVYLGKRSHHIPVLLEVDVTEARAALQRLKDQTGRSVSFTGWAIACLARAVAEHPRVQARRRGRRKLVLFDEVDVALAVYRQVVGDESGERVPMPLVIRRANEKDVGRISDEIQAAQTMPLAPGQQWLDPDAAPPSARLTNLFYRMPRFLRVWTVWNPMLRNPYRAKRLSGTVMVTSVAMFGKTSAWAIPVGIHPLALGLGGIARKPGLVGDRMEPRDILSLTIVFDHDVADGVPVALFVKRLVKLMESAYALGEANTCS